MIQSAHTSQEEIVLVPQSPKMSKKDILEKVQDLKNRENAYVMDSTSTLKGVQSAFSITQQNNKTAILKS